MSYDEAVRKINSLPNRGEANVWIRLCLAQIQDLIRRAASPKCAERRRQLLVKRYETYEEMLAKENQ